MTVLQLVLVLVVLVEVTLGAPQLIGHRGVITLREGQVGPNTGRDWSPHHNTPL